jgi:mannose-6-phosphate isomerase-like protein (cupin superfamily)
MSLIEKYEIKKEGYHPLLIRGGWQVAQLNADSNQKAENIKKLDIHNHTDEVFILTKGKAILITAGLIDNEPIFELELMKPGITYNVPVKTWHNIALQKGSEVIIVEKENTHLSDFECFDLSKEKQNELIDKVNELYRKVL